MVNTRSLWPNKKPYSRRSSILPFSVIFVLLSFLFLISFYFLYPTSLRPTSFKTLTHEFPQCRSLAGERFLWYAPHSGFSNQLSEFKNAVLMAGILNRTLVVPPILDHHAVALGSCPKFRVLEAKEIRVSVWDHVIELIRSGRYVSMADIIDISSLVAIGVQTIDFRNFASLWCGTDIDFSCLNKSNVLKQCRSLLSGFEGNVNSCIYAVNEDCRTTVWTYKKDVEDGVLDSFQPDELLKKKKKVSYIRRRRDVYKSLGPGSNAESAIVLAFGSLFTSPYKGSESYIDIHEAPGDQKIQFLLEKIEYLPFVSEIITGGKKFAVEKIKAPFLCAQLRLLDGQFKNHWKTTFMGLKQKVESLMQKGPLPIHIFVMTDLPEGNWAGSYLGDLARATDNFRLYFLTEEDELLIQTAKKLIASEHSISSGYIPPALDRVGQVNKDCPPQKLPDILLYMEQAVCSCSSLGFVGTAGSTIAEHIELMRRSGTCPNQSQIAL